MVASQLEKVSISRYQEATSAGDERRQDWRVVGIIRYIGANTIYVDDLGLEAKQQQVPRNGLLIPLQASPDLGTGERPT